MKKFGKFLKDLFTKNIGLKILAIILAAVAVVMINIPDDKVDNENNQNSAYITSQEG